MKKSEKSTEQPDLLFQSKLEHHVVMPSADAWNKVEANLSKKNSLLWWRAAAVLLLAGALIGVYLFNQQSAAPTMAQQEKAVTPTRPTSPVKEEKVPHDPTIQALPRKKNEPTIAKTANNPSDEIITTVAQQEAIQQPTERVVTPETQTVVEVATTTEEVKPVDMNSEPTQATLPVNTASTTQKPMKLEFTLEDPSAPDAVATLSEEKKTGIKKILELARNVKDGEGPLAELRGKKDELLAHNFITRKRNH